MKTQQEPLTEIIKSPEPKEENKTESKEESKIE
jgi:hypothetical protein